MPLIIKYVCIAIMQYNMTTLPDFMRFIWKYIESYNEVEVVYKCDKFTVVT